MSRRRFSLRGSDGPVPAGVLGATTLGILDFQRLVALDDHGVWVLDREGREPPTLLYAQRHFVQGYRIVSALAVEPFNGSRVFVGEATSTPTPLAAAR